MAVLTWTMRHSGSRSHMDDETLGWLFSHGQDTQPLTQESPADDLGSVATLQS